MVTKVLKLERFANCTEEFGDEPQVMNGCSDFFIQVFWS